MTDVTDFHTPATWAPSGRRRWIPSPSDDAVVAKGLSLRANWSAIARMLGRPEPDVRRRYDPRYVPVAQPVQMAQPVGKPDKRAKPRSQILTYLVSHPRANTVQVVAALDWSHDWIKTTLCQLREDGLIESPKRGSYLITEAGKAALAGVRT